MLQKMLTGWTLTRAIYLVIGLVFIIDSIINLQWFGIMFGGYFASMGLFNFGCAAGGCKVESKNTDNKQSQLVEFEEVK